MARIRTVKPEFWTDEKVVECSIEARLLFIGLFNFADDVGNLVNSPKRIKMQIFPADTINCEPLLNELIAQGLLIEYSVNDISYLHIKGFCKHQKINRPTKPTIPNCPALIESINKKQDSFIDNSSNSHDALNEPGSDIHNQINEDSVSAHGVIIDGKEKEGKGKGRDQDPNTQSEKSDCSRYAFEGEIIKLNHSDFELWQKNFPNIDLVYELKRLDLEFAHDKPSKWFTSASAKLAYQDRQAKTRQPVIAVSAPMNYVPEGFE